MRRLQPTHASLHRLPPAPRPHDAHGKIIRRIAALDMINVP
jgi:hypothetical protein